MGFAFLLKVFLIFGKYIDISWTTNTIKFPQIPFFFAVCGLIPGNAQWLFMTLLSGITPVDTRGTLSDTGYQTHVGLLQGN